MSLAEEATPCTSPTPTPARSAVVNPQTVTPSTPFHGQPAGSIVFPKSTVDLSASLVKALSGVSSPPSLPATPQPSTSARRPQFFQATSVSCKATCPPTFSQDFPLTPSPVCPPHQQTTPPTVNVPSPEVYICFAINLPSQSQESPSPSVNPRKRSRTWEDDEQWRRIVRAKVEVFLV